MEFARFLNERKITVNSVHNSKLNGFFRGVHKAAFFKTDKGILEVVFFPDNGAEKLSLIEHRENKRYIYSFRGQPQPNPPGDIFNAAWPMYFITHGGWFIVTLDEKTFDAVKSLFKPDAPQQFVGRERRERVLELDWSGEGRIKSRRVDSDVGCLFISPAFV